MRHFVAQMLFTGVVLPFMAGLTLVEWLMGMYEDDSVDEYEKRRRLAVWILLLTPLSIWGLFDLLSRVFNA